MSCNLIHGTAFQTSTGNFRGDKILFKRRWHFASQQKDRHAHACLSIGKQGCWHAGIDKKKWKGVSSHTAKAFAADEEGPNASEVGQTQLLMQWLLANGVTGIGSEESSIGLYETVDGSRGILFSKDVRKGDLLASIPLKLALTDHVDDSDGNEALGKNSPSDLRLAKKLLQQVQLGEDSQWWPFLQVLPRSIKSLFGDWPDASSHHLQVKEIAATLESASTRAKSFELPDHSREDIRWALSIVHSRSFMTAGVAGGQGVRMLLPLADLFNHGGHVALNLLSGPSTPTDNVEWTVVPPEGDSGWSFQFRAAEDAEAGSEALVSYGNNSSWSFLLHYGFTPQRNTNDHVIAFIDVSSAVQWFLERFSLKEDSDRIAAEVTRTAQSNTASLPDSLAEDAVAQAQLKNFIVTAQGGLDIRLLDALKALIAASEQEERGSSEKLQGSTPDTNTQSTSQLDTVLTAKAKRLVGLRLMEILLQPQMTSLLTDLKLLSHLEMLDSEDRAYYAALTQYYTQLIATIEENCGDFLILAGLTSKPDSDGSSTLSGGQEASIEAVGLDPEAFDETTLQCVLWRASQKQIMWSSVAALMG